jgi:hypothetical protein
MDRRACVLVAAAWIAAATFAGAACGTARAGAADASSDASADAAGGDDGNGQACSVEAPTGCPDPATRYADVAPLFEQHCVPCHFGTPGGPWPLTSYKHAVDWQDIIRTAMLECTMPPADGGGVMSNEDRLAILNWIRCGYPE